jgi:hypothetical protein
VDEEPTRSQVYTVGIASTKALLSNSGCGYLTWKSSVSSVVLIKNVYKKDLIMQVQLIYRMRLS